MSVKIIETIKTIVDSGLRYSIDITTYSDRVPKEQVENFFRLFGHTEAREVSSSIVGFFHAVECGEHIKCYCDWVPELGDPRRGSVALNDPISAISLALAFFGKDSFPDHSYSFIVHDATPEQAVELAAKILEVNDDVLVNQEENNGHKWLKVGDVNIFFSEEPASVAT